MEWILSLLTEAEDLLLFAVWAIRFFFLSLEMNGDTLAFASHDRCTNFINTSAPPAGERMSLLDSRLGHHWR